MSATVVALCSVVVTVALFAMTQLLLMRSARQDARASAVDAALTALERVARTHSRPVVVRLWTKPELEYALLVPRLLVGLRPKERIVAVWARTRVQAMAAAKTQGEVVLIASDLSAMVSEWYLGQRDAAWFRQEVKDHQPSRSRATRRAFNTSTQVVALVLLAAVSAVLPAAVGSALAQRWFPDRES